MENWETAHESLQVDMEVDKNKDTLNSVEQEARFECVDPCANPSSSTSSSSVYYSDRALSMSMDRDKYSSELEFKIELSKSHWSQLANTDDDDNTFEANLEHFERLKRDVYRWGAFFKDFESLVVGEKIAEGGQAEIYAATLFNGSYDCVVKMFKEGFFLRDLQRQWPEGMIKSYTEITMGNIHKLSDIFHSAIYKDRKGYSKLEWLHGATLLRDEKFKNRFAFVMKRQWGDLRSVIDAQMLGRKNHGPPFSKATSERLMLNIAREMRNLHQNNGIIHRGLKTSNVLVPCSHETNGFGLVITVADFECSIGVVGTGFWRAPEILQQLKDKVPPNKVSFSYKTDVYSFGMMCYEIVTGCIPFGDHVRTKYDVVLNGGRPELPHDLESWMKTIIEDCWHPDPLQRPYFSNVVGLIERGIRDSERIRERIMLMEMGEEETERMTRLRRLEDREAIVDYQVNDLANFAKRII